MLNYKKIFSLKPFDIIQKDKEKWYFKNQIILSKYHYKKCSEYKRISNRIFKNIIHCKSTHELPFVHVKNFKEFSLKSIKTKQLSRTLESSGTSNQTTSKIYIDRKTSLLQSSALLKIFSNIIKKKINFFFLDNPATFSGINSLSAKIAAIRGFSQLSKESKYLLDKQRNLKFNELSKFLNKNPKKEFAIFGFTSEIWFQLIKKLNKKKINFPKNNGILLHGGGWKKLQNQSVNREFFNKNILSTLGIEKIHNYYGMVEQTGSVFLECEYGFFHTSIFSEIYIRDHNLNLAPNQKKGLIQILSLLPLSYPGHNILTEDIGLIIGADDCKCGRKGKYFLVLGRVSGTENRGCSDVYE
jgi:phenylacetate-coenzyme A ligase PaaK-like adenylate-forming protein